MFYTRCLFGKTFRGPKLKCLSGKRVVLISVPSFTFIPSIVLGVAGMVWSQDPPAAPPVKVEDSDINTIPGNQGFNFEDNPCLRMSLHVTGVAGKDYPNYHDVPKTNFGCSGKIAGYYADVEARCQVRHCCSFIKKQTHHRYENVWLNRYGTTAAMKD